MTGHTTDEITPDLGSLRKLSADTLQRFGVENNGTGWHWHTVSKTGQKATRWKSYYSSVEDAPESERATWKKYLWKPAKPSEGFDYFSPGGLVDAIKAAHGILYLVGGEIDVMTMYEAGVPNTTCFFGESNVPDTLADDLKAWGVTILYNIPDRDNTGLSGAVKVRDLLKDAGITVITLGLPYPFQNKHGNDISDYWRNFVGSKEEFRLALADLDVWELPQPQPKVIEFKFEGESEDLPEKFLTDVMNALGVKDGFGSDGWARKNVKCPFHDDQVSSATWNNQKHILKCHASCGKSYLAKEVGEKLNIRLADYFDAVAPKAAANTPKTAPTLEIPAIATKSTLRCPLPPGVELTPEQTAIGREGRNWLDLYTDWASACSPLTPRIIHEAIGLWLLASISTRRMKLSLGGEDIYPNLYIMIVAKTTLYRKTSAMKLASKVLDLAKLNSLKLVAESTPEALFENLAGVKPTNFESLDEESKTEVMMSRAFAAQRTFIKDEASSILANLKKEYMGGLAELLLQGYDGDTGSLTRMTKSGGLITIRDMCLSFLGATTPVMWAKHVQQEEYENGLIARFGIITPEAIPDYVEAPDCVDEPKPVIQGLRKMFLNTLKWDKRYLDEGGIPRMRFHDEVVSPPVTSVSVNPPALEQIKKYRKALGYDLIAYGTLSDSKAAGYARLGTMMVKIALLLAAVEADQNGIRIDASHVYAAQEITERWRESLDRLDLEVRQSSGNELNEKLLHYVQKAGSHGASIRDMQRDLRVKDRNGILNALKTLAEDGQIEQFQYAPPGRGRPSIRYRFGSETTDKVG